MNTIYLIRHSKTLKVSNLFNNESLQFQNEKKSLSIEIYLIMKVYNFKMKRNHFQLREKKLQKIN